MALKKIKTWIDSDKPTLAAFITTLIAIALVTWWADRTFAERIRQDLDHTLNAILDINHTAMDLWINEHSRRIQFAAESPGILAITEKLLTLPRDRKALMAAQTEPRKQLAWLYKMGGYQGYFIIAPDSINISSSHNANIGMANTLIAQPEMLNRLWAGEVVLSHPMISNVPLPDENGELATGQPTMFVGAPLRDRGGKIIALLTLRIDPAKEFFPLLQAARISDSGESYVFNRDGDMLSESRFTGQLNESGLLPLGKSAVGTLQIRDPGADLTQNNAPAKPLQEQPLTRMAASAAEGERGADLEGYHDYRGVPVVGVWMWDIEMDFGMTVQQDVADAYQPLYMFRSLLFGFAIFTAMLLTGLMVLSIKGRVTLQKSQARLQGLVDTLVDGVVVINERGIIESINPTVERQFGYAAKELIGSNVSLLMPTSDQQHHDSYLHSFINTGKAKVIGTGREALARRKDGREFPVEIAISEMWLGKKRYFTGIIRDITQYKQAEDQLNMLNDELRMLALVAQETDNAVIVTDKKGHILWVNRSFITNSEYALEEALEQQLGDLLQQSGSAPEEIQSICAALHSGQKVTTELLTHSKSGRPYWISMEVSPVFDGNDELKEFIIIERDITELHQIMNELQQAKEKAEEANHSKSSFLAAMSHEIRTPMNGVIGMIDVLERSALSAQQHKLTTTIRDSAFALLGIIDDILDFSKIEAGRLDLEEIPTDLCSLLEGVGETLQPLAEQKNVELTLFCDPHIPPIKTDPVRVRQILFNLTGNAIKFSGERDVTGSVTVRAYLLELLPDQRQARIRMQVSDNGIGMSQGVQQRLFQPFVQAENSTTRRYGGTGLGLVICRRLVGMMGGAIKLQSEEGQGSIFTVDINFETVVQEQAATNLELAGVTTLLAGFDDVARDIMTCYMAHAGARVLVEASVDECARRLNASPSSGEQVVIVDDRRTRLGGNVLYQQFSAQTNINNLRLLVITGNGALPTGGNENFFYLRMHSLNRAQLIRTLSVIVGRLEAHSEADNHKETLTLGAPITVAEARQRGQLILVAEDNKTNVKVILHQLELIGYAAEVAHDGREALERWRNDDFALVLTDCHMPEMDGYDLTRAIRREEPEGQRIPIIAITADALSGTQSQCLEAGMDDYLTKPTQVETLRKKLAQWLPIERPEEPTETSRAAVQTSQAEVVNPQTLIDAIGSDERALLADFYQDFINTLNETIVEIDLAYNAGDYLAIGGLAHRLKSAASTTGAIQLAECCLAMEMAGKGDDRATVDAQMPLLHGYVESVRGWVERYITG
jgi:PAS domain S-box-containing protein